MLRAMSKPNWVTRRDSSSEWGLGQKRTLSFSDTSVYDPAHPTVLDLSMADDTEGILTDFSKRHSAARPCLDSGFYPRLHS